MEEHVSISKNVLLICGGDSTEHEISLLSADFILSKLEKLPNITPYYLKIQKDGKRVNLQNHDCELRKSGEVFNKSTNSITKLHYAIPCIHGPPGENGQIQAVFEMMGLPFLGAGSEASTICFNKLTTKLWLENIGVPTTPFVSLHDLSSESLEKAKSFFKSSGENVFVKASSQGSSIGCYQVTAQESLENKIEEAFKYSPFVLIEKTLNGRELEVAAFQYEDNFHVSYPGEIVCPQGFYDFSQKYSEKSDTKTIVKTENLSSETISTIKDYSCKAFKGLKLKDLARIDFFLTEEKELFINEINTFPGHTSISMFPMMMKEAGVSYEDFLTDRLKSARD